MPKVLSIRDPSEAVKLSPREFIYKAIRELRKPPYKGIHVVFSGFNAAYKAYFGQDPRAEVDRLVEAGMLEMRPAKRGVTIYLSGEAPALRDAAATLKKILK